jgi:hypothetical protein
MGRGNARRTSTAAILAAAVGCTSNSKRQLDTRYTSFPQSSLHSIQPGNNSCVLLVSLGKSFVVQHNEAPAQRDQLLSTSDADHSVHVGNEFNLLNDSGNLKVMSQGVAMGGEDGHTWAQHVSKWLGSVKVESRHTCSCFHKTGTSPVQQTLLNLV